MFSRLRKRSGISPFSLTGILLTLFFLLLAQYDPPLLHELRLKSFDFFLRHNPAPLSADHRIIIVDIDSESLEKFGQWPWPRKHIADLLKKITAAGPAVVAFDILFAEPDSSSPHLLAGRDELKNAPATVRKYLQTLPDYDHILAQTLKQSPVPVVLGYFFTNSTTKKVQRTQRTKEILRQGSVILHGQDPLPFLFSFNGVDSGLEIFQQSVRGIGFLNIIPDQDSILRNIPLVVRYGGEIYPSMILSVLQAASEEKNIELQTDQNGIRAVQTGGYQIPTNMHGELIINFSGPARTLPYVSAQAILSDHFDADMFRDAYVLIGTSAPGLYDIQAVPTDRAFPGVELHGHALNTILGQKYFQRPEWAKGAELLYICGMSLILITVLSRMEAIKGGLLVLFLSLTMILFSFWCMYHCRLMLDTVYPLAVTWILFTVLTFYNF
ncbi:MAG: CHASE2 domain-containing protein, partial [Candidatus Electrothrix sp. EH2]|nr:CHASE2 domain-containing protein [Candidatus Electrothrix sp. EH2]